MKKENQILEDRLKKQCKEHEYHLKNSRKNKRENKVLLAKLEERHGKVNSLEAKWHKKQDMWREEAEKSANENDEQVAALTKLVESLQAQLKLAIANGAKLTPTELRSVGMLPLTKSQHDNFVNTVTNDALIENSVAPKSTESKRSSRTPTSEKPQEDKKDTLSTSDPTRETSKDNLNNSLERKGVSKMSHEHEAMITRLANDAPPDESQTSKINEMINGESISNRLLRDCFSKPRTH